MESSSDAEKVINDALHALCGYRSPALTKKKQEAELARCYEILSNFVWRDSNNDGKDKDEHS